MCVARLFAHTAKRPVLPQGTLGGARTAARASQKLGFERTQALLEADGPDLLLVVRRRVVVARFALAAA